MSDYLWDRAGAADLPREAVGIAFGALGLGHALDEPSERERAAPTGLRGVRGQTAPRRESRIARLPTAEQLLADYGVQTVRADEQVGVFFAPIGEELSPPTHPVRRPSRASA